VRSFDLSYCAFETVAMRPLVARDFKGVVSSEGSDDGWLAGAEVTIIVRSVSDPQVEQTVVAATPSGAFAFPALAEGDYCYQVHVEPFGWECVDGLLRLRQDGPSEGAAIVVPLGK
jgi:hypothetical protein